MNDPRLCIIGAGVLATRRIYPYLGAAGAELVGVCDFDSAKAAQNARRFGGRPYTDLREMLGREKPDGVIVCVGPETHAALAREILSLGYPVYTEKPPATTAAEALEVARAAHRAGLLCTTAFKKRYTEATTRARGWLSKFPAEDRLSISVDYCSGPYDNTTPRSTFLLDFALHLIDLVPFLFGEVSEVFAFSRSQHAYAVSLRFANGAVGTLNLNDGRSFSVPTEEIELTLKGGNFMTIHNSSCWRITENQHPAEWREPSTFTSAGDSGRDTGHLAEIEDFVAALKEGRKTTPADIFQSYRTMVLHDAIKLSAERDEIVSLAYESLDESPVPA